MPELYGWQVSGSATLMHVAQIKTRTGRQAPAVIVDAALRLFLARGVDAVSLGAIADEVGVTKAAVYHHFKTKDALVLSTFEPLLDKLTELGQRDMPAPALMKHLIELAVEHHELVLLAQPPVIDGLASRTLQHLQAATETLLIKLAPEGTPQARVRALMLLAGICAVLRDQDSTPASLAELRRVVDLVMPSSSPT